MSAVGPEAGFEDEVAAWRRLRGEPGAVEDDDERAVEEFAHLHGAAGQGAAGRELQPARAEAARRRAGSGN
ncbi:MAG: hypothetical protein DME01_25680 [Candidatus Rokuibacteriota bacterium]|nr:MAG: hypothetical protein DME01_25680 [Candidatus Rokubacteria bacterium]